jgi:hypothetical protein
MLAKPKPIADQSGKVFDLVPRVPYDSLLDEHESDAGLRISYRVMGDSLLGLLSQPPPSQKVLSPSCFKH